eukprot:TRINITY_DN33014_c0_g1_i1.p1 TRINITY_DN33014_c0_g1~~TRINITY_DN33014_c0_g1_i1.p1  ORF type:complete len:613 (+),score=141.52 TRINITY_DN33014_c0_g1_i1:89-1927(+)
MAFSARSSVMREKSDAAAVEKQRSLIATQLLLGTSALPRARRRAWFNEGQILEVLLLRLDSDGGVPASNKVSSWLPCRVHEVQADNTVVIELPNRETRLIPAAKVNDSLRKCDEQEVGKAFNRQLVRGVGITVRLFEALRSSKSYIRACDASYIPTIKRHVQSVEPSKNVMAQQFVPIVMENEEGGRQVFHVDPLAVRKFRREMAQELMDVQEKRQRLLQRIKDIRADFPEAKAFEMVGRLRREITEASERADENLLNPLPDGSQAVYILIDTTPNMVQLTMVCDMLAQELPQRMVEASANKITLAPLGAKVWDSGCQHHPPRARSSSNLADIPLVIHQWLSELRSFAEHRDSASSKQVSLDGGNETRQREQAAAQLGQSATSIGQSITAASAASAPALSASWRSGNQEVRLSKALRSALGSGDADGRDGNTTVLLVTSSSVPGNDLESCVQLVRKSTAVLQVVGIFGASPVDPEPALQRIVDASAAPDLARSRLRLFFGPVYWRNFAASRKRKLEKAEKAAAASAAAAAKALGDVAQVEGLEPERDSAEVVSPTVFELRLIERVLRECYVEEQRCEEELLCATKLLERSAVDREEVIAAMRAENRFKASDE